MNLLIFRRTSMNSNKTIIISVLVMSLFFLVKPAESQIKYSYGSKWKSPFFTIEVAGSYNPPIQDAHGEVADFFKFKDYGTSIGWGAQFNFKFGLGPKAQYRPYITLGYCQLFGSDDKNAYIETNYIRYGYPLPGSAVYGANPLKGESAIILRIPYAGVGFEYAFTTADPKRRQYIPFIGSEFYLSVITGKYRQTSPQAPYSHAETPFIIKSDVRFGLGLGAGMDIRFTKGFGMVFGFKYKLSNLIGKTADYLKEENKMNLLDYYDTDMNSNLKESRSIGFMELYLGASFFVGKSDK
jgi:hypothetical protein